MPYGPAHPMRRNLVVAVLAGAASIVFARGGDTWGAGTWWQDVASVALWPWFLIVGAIGVTAPRLWDAVTRATLAMVLMVIGYNVLSGGLDLEGNRQSFLYWSAAAVTVVPAVAAAAYGVTLLARRVLPGRSS